MANSDDPTPQGNPRSVGCSDLYGSASPSMQDLRDAVERLLGLQFELRKRA